MRRSLGAVESRPSRLPVGLEGLFDSTHSRILLRKLKIYLQYVLSLHFISSKVMSFRLTQQHNYERDCLRKAREAYLIHTAKTIKPLSSHTLPSHTM